MLGAFADRAIRHKQNRNSQWKEIKSQNKNQELSRISGNRWRSKKLRFYSFDMKWVEYFNKVRTLFWGGGVGGLCPETVGAL